MHAEANGAFEILRCICLQRDKEIAEELLLFFIFCKPFSQLRVLCGSLQGRTVSLFLTLGRQEMNGTPGASRAGQPVGRSSSADFASFPC